MRLQYFIFVVLLTIFTFNLNGVAFLLFRRATLFSIPILLLSLFVITLNINKSRNLYLTFNYLKNWIYFFISYLFLGTLGMFNSGVFRNSNIDTLRTLLTTVLIIYSLTLMIVSISDKINVKKLIRTFTILLTLSTFFILVIDYFSLNLFIEEKYGTRNPGLFVNPNDGGLVAVISYIFLLFNLKESTNKAHKTLIIISCLLVVYATFLTFSKAAYVGIVAVSLFYALVYIRKSFMKIIFSSALIALIISTQWETLKQGLDKNQIRRVLAFENILSGEIDNETTTGRSEINVNSWFLISERPVFGYGLGNFENFSRLEGASHNTFFQIWGEAGIIPLLLFILILMRLAYKVFKSKININHQFLIYSFVATIFLFSLTSNNILDNRVVNIFLAFTSFLLFFKPENENSLLHR